jgi:hypothetical protein
MFVWGNQVEAAGSVGGERVGWFTGPVLGNGAEQLQGWAVFSDSAVAIWQPDAPLTGGTNDAIVFRRDPFYSNCQSGATAPYANVEAYSQVTGSQQVTIDYVAVDVSATKSRIQAGEPVTFQANAVNFSAQANFLYWTYWTGPFSSIPVDSCVGLATCIYSPTAPGRMTADMRVSGLDVYGSSAQISIIPCPTGDPLLDAGLTEELERVLQKSLQDPSKHEFKGGVFKDNATGTLRFQELPTIANDPNGCWIKTGAPQGNPNETLVATYHGHPHYEGETLICTDPITGAVRPPVKVDYTTWAGVSPEDWTAALSLSANVGHIVPTYVLDLNRLHRLNPVTSNQALWNSNVQTWMRCKTPTGG